jgi:hypothetical protein
MTILLETLSDPIWQALAIALVLAALLMLMVVRTRDAHLSAARKRLESRLVLIVCLVVFVLMSGGEILLHFQQASSPQGSSRTSTIIPTPVPQASPTPTSVPSPSPTPTATPRLARSITAVLTTFCDALTHRDYQTAWLQYARSLQRTHPEAQTIAAWERYTRCNMPEQSGDPAAWTILTLTLLPGSTDRFGRSGDIDYRFTMSDQDNVWTISGICTIMSEGCFAIDWG